MRQSRKANLINWNSSVTFWSVFAKDVNYLKDWRKLSRLFVVAPCMLIVSSPLFFQLMHTNYYKIVKQLKSFKIIIVAPTCFGLHKPSSGSSQHVLR